MRWSPIWTSCPPASPRRAASFPRIASTTARTCSHISRARPATGTIDRCSGGSGGTGRSAAGKWKLTWSGDAPPHLYDLAADIEEEQGPRRGTAGNRPKTPSRLEGMEQEEYRPAVPVRSESRAMEPRRLVPQHSIIVGLNVFSRRACTPRKWGKFPIAHGVQARRLNHTILACRTTGRYRKSLEAGKASFCGTVSF